MKQMILKITEGTDFELMPPLLQEIAMVAGIVWPQAMMIGTQPVLGHQLILIMANTSKTVIESWLTDGYPVYNQDTELYDLTPLDLDWEVLAVEGEEIDQSLILPFMANTPVIDEQGDIVGSEPVTDVTGKLQTWAGHKWTY